VAAAAEAAKHFRDAFAAQLNLILARRALLNLDLAKNQKRHEKVMKTQKQKKNTNKLKSSEPGQETETEKPTSSPAEAAGRPGAWPTGVLAKGKFFPVFSIKFKFN